MADPIVPMQPVATGPLSLPQSVPNPAIPDAPPSLVGMNGGTQTDDLQSIQNATAQAPPSLAQQPKQGRLKSLLLNMAQGASLALGYESGIPQAQALQAQTAKENATLPYAGQIAQGQAEQLQLENQTKQAQLKAAKSIGTDNTGFANLTPDEKVVLNTGIRQLAMGNPSGYQQAIHQIAQNRAVQGRQIKSVPGLGMWDFRDPANPSPISGTAPASIDVTADVAAKYGLPAQTVGQKIAISALAPYVRAAVFGQATVTGAEGPALVNKNPLSPDFGKTTKLGLGSPAQAGAYWQAKYGVVKTVDPESGEPMYATRLNAPGMATDNNAFQIFKGKAGLDNFKDALGRVNSNLDVLNDTNQRALVAQTLRNIGTVHDPGIISSIVGGAVSSGLDPKAADLVAATLNAREWIGANRSFAGNFQGSEALYNRMVANIAGPMNSPEVNRALIKQDLDNTSRIEDRIVKFQGGGKGAPPKGAPSQPTSSWHSDIPGAVPK